MSTVQHATMTIERTYPAPRGRVFAAWADPQLKARWFDEPGASEGEALASDFREGGRETASGSFQGKLYTYDAVYRDIVADDRIVLTYEMSVDGRRMSVSVATVELADEGAGTRLLHTEQCAFLDDLDRREWREQGIGGQLDRLAGVLADAAPRGR